MAAFKKGNTKAKGGTRPGAGRKPSAIVRAAKELFDEGGPHAAVYLIRVARGDIKAKTSDRIDAAKIVLEHWKGKPKQQVDVAGDMVYKLYGKGTPLEDI